MSAGSGPMIASASAVVLPANTTENVLCTLPPGNWNNPNQLGNLVSFSVLATGAATGTITFRVRQGNSAAGALVGAAVAVSVVNAGVYTPSVDFPDASAFGQAQQGGQYVLTYQQSANSLGTVNSAVLELETVAPLN